MSAIEAHELQVYPGAPRLKAQARLRVVREGEIVARVRPREQRCPARPHLRAVPSPGSAPSAKSAQSALSTPSAASPSSVESNKQSSSAARFPSSPHRTFQRRLDSSPASSISIAPASISLDSPLPPLKFEELRGRNIVHIVRRPEPRMRRNDGKNSLSQHKENEATRGAHLQEISIHPNRAHTHRRLHALRLGFLASVSAGAVMGLVALGVAIGSFFAPDLGESITVQAGDSVWSIAASIPNAPDISTAVSDIQDLNGIGGDYLTPGQMLSLPAYH